MTPTYLENQPHFDCAFQQIRPSFAMYLNQESRLWIRTLSQEIVLQAAARHRWDACTEYELPCWAYEQRHQQIAAEARRVIYEQPQAFVVSHWQGVLWSLVDFKHVVWYPALTGQSWQATGASDNIGGPLWNFILAGDWKGIAHLVWTERVLDLSVGAFCVWWGLIVARIGIIIGVLRGVYRLKAWPLRLLLLGTLLPVRAKITAVGRAGG